MTPLCPGCRIPLSREVLGAEGRVSCPYCHVPLLVEVYPALARPLADLAQSPQASLEGDSTCFNHAGYRATVPCDSCGRFLCNLCDLAIGGRHLCPDCVQRSMQENAPGMTTERMLWDRLAMSLAVLPVITIYFTLLTAPAAIWISVRHWKSPGSLVAPGRWRFVLASLFAAMQLSMWVLIIWFVAQGFPNAASD